MNKVVPTKEEVDKRYDDREERDIIGFEVGEYMVYMSFEKVRSMVKDDVSDSAIRNILEPVSRDYMIKSMHDYMEFAWGKANDMRGISANRSIGHYVAWTWLAGDVSLSKEIEDMAVSYYCYYGKPILERICEFYGWEWNKWDDGARTNG